MSDAAIQSKQDFYTNDLVPRLDESPTFLGNCEFLKHFYISTRNDNHLDNQTFLDPNTKREKTFLVFGEIASTEHGTKIGAQGNHYSAPYNTVRSFPYHLLSKTDMHNSIAHSNP